MSLKFYANLFREKSRHLRHQTSQPYTRVKKHIYVYIYCKKEEIWHEVKIGAVTLK